MNKNKKSKQKVNSKYNEKEIYNFHIKKEIYFEEEIIVLDASIPYTIDDEIYTFELGDVGIGQCGSFTVTDSISCEAVLGSAVCAMAYIYPDDHCREISEEWDGSDIEVSAECLGDVVRFSIANNGEALEDS